jgi:heme exporter protein B
MTNAIATLIRKDLLLEWRNRETLPVMLLFCCSSFVIFHFALGNTPVEGQLAAGVLWIAIAFAALLAINRLFVIDHDQGGIDSFLLAPVDRTTLYVAKALLLFLYLTVLELIAVPIFSFLLLKTEPTTALPELIGVFALTNAGVALMGALVAAISIRTRTRELIVSLLALPLIVPLFLAATNASAPFFTNGMAPTLPTQWLIVLALYDMVFGLLSVAIFDYLLED